MSAKQPGWISLRAICVMNAGCQPHTLSNYRRDLDGLVAYCDRQQIPGWRQLQPAQVRLFAARLHQRGLSGRSIQRALSSLRSFCRYLIRQGELSSNPAQDIRAPRSPRKLPHSLDVDRIQTLLDVKPGDWLSQRDVTMMELTVFMRAAACRTGRARSATC